MHSGTKVGLVALGIVGVAGLWEGAWWFRRRHRRVTVFAQAQARALKLGRTLVVVGSPDGGVTSGYGCGDVTVDVNGSTQCPRTLKADVTKKLPFDNNSVVVFVSCVLEYVADVNAAACELLRVSGGLPILLLTLWLS